MWPPTRLLEKLSLSVYVCRKYGKTSYKTRYTLTNICNVALKRCIENLGFENCMARFLRN